MHAILQRMPDAEQLAGWFDRNKAKVAGLLFGTLGTTIITMFLVVLITGEPYARPGASPEPVYSFDFD